MAARPEGPGQPAGEALLARVRRTIEEIEPGAQVVLFGSRARGEATADSDWDLLILLDGLVSPERAAIVREQLAGLGRTSGALFSAVIHGKDAWRSARLRATPFHENVTREGRLVGTARATMGVAVATGTERPLPEAAMAEARDDILRDYLAQAREALEDAELLVDRQRLRAAVNRLYYACFYAVTAALLRDGRSASKHTGIRSLFHQHLVRPGRVPVRFGALYDTLFDNRHRADYEVQAEFAAAEVAEWLAGAREFVRVLGDVTGLPDRDVDG